MIATTVAISCVNGLTNVFIVLAKQLIDSNIPTLGIQDTGLRALDRMEAFRVSHLPIISIEDEFLGLVSDINVYDANNFELRLAEYTSPFIKPHVHENQHLLEIAAFMRRFDLSCIPVLSMDHAYVGSISRRNILDAMIQYVDAEEVGGIMVLEMCELDYSLVEISQIVESNEAKILSLSVVNVENSKEILVTIKVNRTDLSSLIQAFTRYDYTIQGTYNDNSRLTKYYDDRFDEFVKYLDL